jgi:hypothetical protein
MGVEWNDLQGPILVFWGWAFVVLGINQKAGGDSNEGG